MTRYAHDAETSTDIEAQLNKVEVDEETCKEGLARVERAIDEFCDNMERGFAEQQKETSKYPRWLYGLIFTNLTFACGILIHLASCS